jgi:hypothetical protein
MRIDEKSLGKSLRAIETVGAIEGLDRHGASATIRLSREKPTPCDENENTR